ncbi:MAG: ThiF family adenylyltransferase [Neisseriaceae bacterium]|nr:ThiF family adenylyltransferase [Neisseriaceae bacterium]
MQKKAILASKQFLAWGYRFEPQLGSKTYIFKKTYTRQSGNYSVRFELTDQFHFQKPEVFLESMPEKKRSSRLPHLLFDYSICLFNSTETIDPIDVPALIAGWISKLESIIDIWEDGNFNDDFIQEFSNYWAGFGAYLLDLVDDMVELKSYFYDRLSLEGKLTKEWVLTSDKNKAIEWSKRRKALTELDDAVPVIKLAFQNTPRITLNKNWPPETITEVLEWIEKEPLGHKLMAQLIQKIERQKGTVFLVVCHFDKEIFGFSLGVDRSFREALAHFFAHKRGKSIAKISLQQLLVKFKKASKSTKIFTRLSIYNCSGEFLLSRNAKNDRIQLKDKKILLIGCGTIGGYLAKSLVQIGAGFGKGELILCDPDKLQPGNLGRHILGVQYLGEYKSAALAHSIREDGLGAEVVSLEVKFLPEAENLKDYDLVINATGDEAFSLLLSQAFYNLKLNDTQAPLLIHGWISGFGNSAKALLEDGRRGCYACQFKYKPGSIKEDIYPTLGHSVATKDFSPFKRSCSELHLPFATDASLLATSMVIQLVQSRAKNAPNLLMRGVSDVAERLKDHLLRKRPGCPICGN